MSPLFLDVWCCFSFCGSVLLRSLLGLLSWRKFSGSLSEWPLDQQNNQVSVWLYVFCFIFCVYVTFSRFSVIVVLIITCDIFAIAIFFFRKRNVVSFSYVSTGRKIGSGSRMGHKCRWVKALHVNHVSRIVTKQVWLDLWLKSSEFLMKDVVFLWTGLTLFIF